MAKQIVTKKIKLIPVGDKEEVKRVYRYVYGAMKVNAIMMNQCISAMYVAIVNHADKEAMRELSRLYSRVPSSKKGSAYTFSMDNYPVGLALAGGVPRVCRAKLDKAVKDGLMYGRVSLPTFRSNAPFPVPSMYVGLRDPEKNKGRLVGLFHNYPNFMEFSDALYHKRTPELYLQFVNKIVFKLYLGDIHRSYELRKCIERIFTKEYRVCDSSMAIKDNDIFLHLCLEIPKVESKLDENKTVYVTFGEEEPVICSLQGEEKTYIIGSRDAFLHKKEQIRQMRVKLQSELKYSSGGHGRKKKLRKLDKFEHYERDFAKTQNHYFSRHIVDYALRQEAKYICVADTSDMGKDEKQRLCLGDWSYFELCKYIQYKAQAIGCEVFMDTDTNTKEEAE